MILLWRFSGGPGLDDTTGLQNSYIPPLQARSRTSTLFSDSHRTCISGSSTRSCQSHADASSPPWDFGWRRGFSPARTRVMATFAGWCCLLWLIPAQMASVRARRTWLWHRWHLASLWFAWFEILSKQKHITSPLHWSFSMTVQWAVYPAKVNQQKAKWNSKMGFHDVMLHTVKTHSQLCATEWNKSSTQTRVLQVFTFILITQTAVELVCNRSETVTVPPEYDYCFHTCRRELHAGRGQTGKVWKPPWCIKGELLPWVSEQKASGITSLCDEMAWWVHFKKRLVILFLVWKWCCSSSCV